MNHCRRCDSDYEKPGTCNCFAEKPVAQPLPFVPWYPYWTQCPVCGRWGCTTTHITWGISGGQVIVKTDGTSYFDLSGNQLQVTPTQGGAIV